MVTRAKALLLVLGDQDTLKQDERWNHLIELCANNGSLVSAKDRVSHPRIKFD